MNSFETLSKNTDLVHLSEIRLEPQTDQNGLEFKNPMVVTGLDWEG